MSKYGNAILLRSQKGLTGLSMLISIYILLMVNLTAKTVSFFNNLLVIGSLDTLNNDF